MYCIKCGKDNPIVYENGLCQHCGAPLITDRELNVEEKHSLLKGLHNRYNESREKVDNALVFVVLGTTLLLIGLLFLFLSNKVDQETWEKAIKPTCTEFFVSMLGLGIGGTLLVLGLVRFIKEKTVIQKETLRMIKTIQNDNYQHIK